MLSEHDPQTGRRHESDSSQELVIPSGRSYQLRLRSGLVSFRTLNGFRLWDVTQPGEAEETDALRIRRLYQVRSPAGECRICAVDITTSVRGQVCEIRGSDVPPQNRLWDLLCRGALSNYLWERGEFPPEDLLVYGLTPDQLSAVRHLVSSGAMG